MSVLKEIATRYFAAFANKDAASLAALLADDVSLQDWELAVSGKAAVLQANQAIFDALQAIAVRPILLVEETDVVVAQLEILINGTDCLRVVDILHFNQQRKICRVTAYKG